MRSSRVLWRDTLLCPRVPHRRGHGAELGKPASHSATQAKPGEATPMGFQAGSVENPDICARKPGHTYYNIYIYI